MPNKICFTCGKSFHVKPSQMSRRKHCSKECTKRQVEKECLYCGKLFIVQQYREKTAKFCSTSCQAKYQWKNKIFKAEPLSEEHKKKLSEIHKKLGTVPPLQKGKTWTLSEKTRRKMSEYQKKIGWIPPSRKGEKHCEKTKQKLREIRLKQKFHTKDTSIELLLQKELNKRGVKYQKHITVCNICQPDIVFPEKKVAVFADGDYWHTLPKHIENDKKQNKILSENGWKIFRFWGSEIRKDPELCINKILEHWDTRVGEDPLA